MDETPEERQDEWKGWLLILVGPTALAFLAFAATVLWMAIRGSQ